MAKKIESEKQSEPESSVPGKKSSPTRSRREAEAANRRPLVPNDRKLAKKVERQKRDEAYARERQALETGDERYLPYRDKGPVRRYVRDWIDARWSISEFLLPAMLLFLAGVLVMSLLQVTNETATMAMFGLMIIFYALLGVSAVEATVVWQRMKRRIKKLYPKEPIPKGTWFYVYTRMLMTRRWRSPKPQVSRGQYPDPDGSRAKAKAAKTASTES